MAEPSDLTGPGDGRWTVVARGVRMLTFVVVTFNGEILTGEGGVVVS
jgi:hypothetical protein